MTGTPDLDVRVLDIEFCRPEVPDDFAGVNATDDAILSFLGNNCNKCTVKRNISDPLQVCANDTFMYANQAEIDIHNCRARDTQFPSVVSPCILPCNSSTFCSAGGCGNNCPTASSPVCDTNGAEHATLCNFKNEVACNGLQATIAHNGPCYNCTDVQEFSDGFGNCIQCSNGTQMDGTTALSHVQSFCTACSAGFEGATTVGQHAICTPCGAGQDSLASSATCSTIPDFCDIGQFDTGEPNSPDGELTCNVTGGDNSNGVPIGNKCSVTCSGGWEQVDPVEATQACHDDGAGNGIFDPISMCEKTIDFCPPLDAPTHGQEVIVIPSGNVVGSQISVTCNPGRTKAHNVDFVTCSVVNSTGAWLDIQRTAIGSTVIDACDALNPNYCTNAETAWPHTGEILPWL